MSEHSFYQIEHTGVNAPTSGPGVTTRDPNMKVSNFGALFFGSRMSSDYTRTTLDFAEKGIMEGADSFGMHDLVQDAEMNENPLLAGSSLKYTRDDQMFKMGMANDRGTNIDQPMFDVMDTNEVSGSFTSGKNYPSEGWRSFGGKYDFAVAYQG